MPEFANVQNINSLPLAQRKCIQDLKIKIEAFGACPPSASGYEEPIAGVGEVTDMVLDRLSLPSGRVAGVNLEDSLEGP